MTRPLRRAQDERGFALLTVIVIVMALTILGLSLFSLSGFEARFFRPTLDQAQAMQSVRGGIDWARYVLQSTDSLDMVRIATRPEGVSGVVARRGIDFDSADSTGSVFKEPLSPIWVRAAGAEGDQHGAALVKFQPNPGLNLYKRLITVLDSMVVDDDGDKPGNTNLYGNIAIGTGHLVDYQGNPITSTTFSGAHCVTSETYPSPGLDLRGQWWQDKYAAAQDLIPGGPLLIGNSGSEPAIYRTNRRDQDDGLRWWSAILRSGETTIQARGTSIWMFPEGLRCESRLSIDLAPGESEATVILVARPGDGPTSALEYDVGFALLGGIDVDEDVRLFVISSGCVEIEHELDPWKTANSNAGYITIYGDWARFRGPVNPDGGNADMALYHGSSCTAVPDPDRKGDMVDRLIDQDLLPNSRFARKHLEFVSGSWQEKPATVGN